MPSGSEACLSAMNNPDGTDARPAPLLPSARRSHSSRATPADEIWLQPGDEVSSSSIGFWERTVGDEAALDHPDETVRVALYPVVPMSLSAGSTQTRAVGPARCGVPAPDVGVGSVLQARQPGLGQAGWVARMAAITVVRLAISSSRSAGSTV
jgi:hypothetical protein